MDTTDGTTPPPNPSKEVGYMRSEPEDVGDLREIACCPPR
jgi:hypothetical protein